VELSAYKVKALERFCEKRGLDPGKWFNENWEGSCPCCLNQRKRERGILQGSTGEFRSLAPTVLTQSILNPKAPCLAPEMALAGHHYSKSVSQSHRGLRSSTSSAIRRASLSRSMARRSRAFASSVRPVRLA
jgi:hypothetical protein